MAYRKIPYPPCLEKFRNDDFKCRAAVKRGGIYTCKALTRTDFIGRCPFYKTRDDYDFDEMRTNWKKDKFKRKKSSKVVIKPGMASK